MASRAVLVTVDEGDRTLAERVTRSIESGQPLVTYDEDGAAYELTGSLRTAFQAMVSRAASAEELVLVPRQAELSPEEAAKILGISRPMVYHRMDTGRLAFREVGTHRRVLLDDVLVLKEFEAERRRVSRALSEDTDAQEPAFGAS